MPISISAKCTLHPLPCAAYHEVSPATGHNRKANARTVGGNTAQSESGAVEARQHGSQTETSPPAPREEPLRPTRPLRTLPVREINEVTQVTKLGGTTPEHHQRVPATSLGRAFFGSQDRENAMNDFVQKSVNSGLYNSPNITDQNQENVVRNARPAHPLSCGAVPVTSSPPKVEGLKTSCSAALAFRNWNLSEPLAGQSRRIFPAVRPAL
jgi:hypothetical protein